jgi:hypothetical protein
LAATPQNLKILAASQHSVPEKLSRVGIIGFLGLCIIKYSKEAKEQNVSETESVSILR